jgi:hypothetical protein
MNSRRINANMEGSNYAVDQLETSKTSNYTKTVYKVRPGLTRVRIHCAEIFV